MKRITVLLAEDHNIVREGFCLILKHETDIDVVGEARTGRQAVQMTRKLRPAVVVMDIAMPLLNGLEATRQIRKEFPDTRVLILSAYSEDAYIEQLSLLGVAGFLLKQTTAHVLATAIREVHKGNTFFSPAISRRREKLDPHSPTRAGGLKERPARLTSREVEVLQLIAEGKANKETAAELGISIKTVEKHREKVKSKLNIHDTAGLTRYAIHAGIIEGRVNLTVD